MAKVIICLLLTCLFSFMGYSSFMTNDYRPLNEWMTYYKEYKELQAAKDKGDLKKAELLHKLMLLYPDKAKQFEDMARSKYIDLSDEAKQVEESVTSSKHTSNTSRDTDTDTTVRQQPAKQQTQQSSQKQSKQDTGKSTAATNTANKSKQ